MPFSYRGSPARAALAAATTAVALYGSAGPATAAPDEIEVYQDEQQPAGGFGLELHNNFVAAGDRLPPHRGGQASAGAYRLTPEFAYGLGAGWELGVLAPAAVDRTGKAAVGALKTRVRWLDAPQGRAWYWGANLEVGRTGRRFEPDPWNGELRLISGLKTGRWSLAVNPSLEWSFRGGPAELELASKASYRLGDAFAVGLESYNALGPARRPGRLGDREQMLYATIDAELKGAALNLGVGRGLTGASDRWVLKAVIEFDLR
jgi:hypothetical protein